MLPECLDDFIAEDNTVRVVDAFTGELDMAALGFEGATPATTGRPSYHPSMLLKLYLYGYLHRIESNWCLEREYQRNVELMCLPGTWPRSSRPSQISAMTTAKAFATYERKKWLGDQPRHRWRTACTDLSELST